MLKRIPLLPTLLVLIAVGIMIRLGVWQLNRLGEKEALLARYTAAQTMAAEAAWPATAAAVPLVLYRRSRIECRAAGVDVPIAGRSASGQPGLIHELPCTLAGGGQAWVVLGWSRDPAPRSWTGGSVSGTLAPRGKTEARLIADPPLAGLAAAARPDPRDIPNNHFSYAIQWFLFAATALVIYALALRTRLKG